MKQITIQVTVNAPRKDVWTYYTKPEHITQWNSASEDWHTSKAENDLRVGGTFSYHMEAKDGSTGFNFEGTYDDVKENEMFAYTMSDGRKVTVVFTDDTTITVTFDPETENPIEMQREGWQAILDNFARHVEANT